jgi:hypothetical protein
MPRSSTLPLIVSKESVPLADARIYVMPPVRTDTSGHVANNADRVRGAAPCARRALHCPQHPPAPTPVVWDVGR